MQSERIGITFCAVVCVLDVVFKITSSTEANVHLQMYIATLVTMLYRGPGIVVVIIQCYEYQESAPHPCITACLPTSLVSILTEFQYTIIN